MDSYKIYLSGAMKDLSRKDQSEWRFEVYKRLMDGDAYYGYKYELDIFNPVVYYNYFDPCHKTEKEIMNFELDNLRKSDLVIVNFDNSETSIGTMTEVAIAYENRIPIIGLSENLQSLNPWQIEMATRICGSMEKLLEHVSMFYLT